MTDRIIHLEGVPLIKFQCKDKIRALQKGTIYMKSLEYYRRCEKETGDDTVGDLFEAMIHANDAHLIIPELGVHEKLSDALLKTSFSDSYVFCMLSVPYNSKAFRFSEEQKEKIMRFGDTALLIKDRDEFLRRVLIAVLRDDLKGVHGFINYYNEAEDNVAFWCSLLKNGMNHVAFWKRKRYAYQQEYRLLIEPPRTDNDYYKLDIGSISDISVILTTSQVLNGFAKENEQGNEPIN